MSSDISREQLHAYLDDALADAELAKIEHALRGDDALRQRLQMVIAERDRGEHSLGAIWRRARLTCANREKLGSYLLGVCEPAEQAYLDFHLQVVACPYCQANLADLESQQRGAEPRSKQRRKRYFESSAGFLQRP